MQRIFQAYLTGDESYASIAIKLNGERDAGGKPVNTTRLGTPFKKGSVEEILRNRTYVGDTVWAPGTPEEEAREGTHEAIITRADFARVEALRQSRANGGGGHPADRVYPLTGQSVCDLCESPYHGDTGSRGKTRRLRHKVGVDCKGRKSFQAANIERQFGEIVRDRVRLPDDTVERCRWLLARPPSADSASRAAEREAIEAERARLVQLFRWGDVSEAEYRRDQAALEGRLRDLSPSPVPTDIIDLNRAADLLGHLGELWFHPGTTLERKHQFVEAITEEIRLGDDGIGAVRPTQDYLTVFAVSEAPNRGGYGRGGRI